MFIKFVIQNHFFSYSLKDFSQILDIPCEGAYVFIEKWSLDELAYGVPMDGPYQTNPPSSNDIILSIRIDGEGQVHRFQHEEVIDVLEYQILTCEIVPTLKPLEEIIREIVFCLGDNQDHVPTCLCYMLYCVTRRDRGTRRGHHSTSSSSAFDQPSSSHLNDDDDDGNGQGTSRDSLIGFDDNRLGWLRDKHVDHWVLYMWHFKQSSQDWSMVSCCFLMLLLQESMLLFYATDEIYPLAWMDVEDVFICNPFKRLMITNVGDPVVRALPLGREVPRGLGFEHWGKN
nr:phospholipase-like protein [Tanacetum cinerariifolium]